MSSMLRLSALVALLALIALPAEAGRDGSGVYSLPSIYDVQAGDTIQPEQLKTPLEDIESTLNTARPVSVGGTGATTAAGARSNLSVQPVTRANDTTGSSNAYALSSEVALTSLTDGDFVLFVANHSNTGAATLNVDSLGAKDMQKAVNGTPTALASGDIDSGGHYLATYDASVGSGTWIVHAITSGTNALENVVEDTTPQLGGNLDLNGNGLTFPGATVTDVTGSDTLAVSGTAGTNGDLAQWNVDGDLVDGPTPPSGTIVGTTDSQTLTNKTISLGSNTVSGTTAEFNTALSDNDFATLAGSETLTNKSLTAPTLTGTVLLSTEVAHTGDTNNKIVLGTDTQDFQTGGASRLDISDSGVRLGGANARVTTVLDEDTMTSDSATALATQQSVKAYVDTEVAGVSAGSMVFIASQDASASANLSFTGFDDTQYDAYVFELANVLPATTGVELFIRTSTDGGATYDSGAGDYEYVVQRVNSSGTRDDTGSTGFSRIPITGPVNTSSFSVDSTAGEGVSGTVRVHGPHLASNTQITSSVTFQSAGAGLLIAEVGGERSAAEDVNALFFEFTSGNIASGTITMYGLKNS